jgi:hypothetical protein
MVLTFEKNKRAYVSDLNNLAVMNLNAVRNGCNVIEHSPLDMGVRVQVGTVFFGSSVVSIAQQDVAISPAHASFDRIDLIVVNSGGTASVITGTAELEPHTPNYDPLSYVVLARVYVDDLVTNIPQSKITDLRIINEAIGTFGKYVEDSITSQTSVAVVHNLGDEEPMVACYDSSNMLTIPESLTIDTADQVTVTFNPAFSGKIVVQGGSGGAGGGGTLKVKEQDGIPTILGVNEIRINNNTLTDEGGGAISMQLDGTPGTYIHTQGSSNLTWTINHNLGQQIVQIMCYDASDFWIQPHQIQLISSNQAVVTFLSTQSGKAIVKK